MQARRHLRRLTTGLVAGLSATAVLLALSTTPASAHPTFAMLTGAGPGGAPLVRAFTNAGASTSPEYQAYVPGFRGGVYVATADVNGDEHADSITGAGSGGAPLVRAVDGITGATLFSFMAYDPGFRGGVTVAAGDINSDGIPDIITGAGQGGAPNVRVFDGDTLAKIVSFNAYGSSFTGGVDVAAGDINSDGFAEIITGAGPGGAPNVRVFDGDTLAKIVSFNAYSSSFGGGVHVGSGDVTGDGLADILTGAGPGGAPNVRVFDGDTLATIYSFNAYISSFTGGVFVSAGDVNADQFADIITGAGPGGGPHVKAFNGDTLATLLSFNAYVPGFRGGVRVAGNLGTHPPVVEVTGGPADEGTTSDSTPTYSGTATDSDGTILDISVSVDFGDFSTTGVNCTGCGTDDVTWSFTPTTPLADGEHVFIFAAIDNSGLIGIDSRTVGIDVIPGPPTVTVNQADTQEDPTDETSIEFTVVFSEPVTGLTADDFVVTGTAPGAAATSLTGGPATYTISITGMTGDGTVIVNLPAAVVVDGADNPNGASTSTDNTVTYDATAPTFDSIASSTSGPTVFATFSESLLCSTVSASDFLASIAGSPVTVTSVSCSGGSDSVIELTLSSTPTAGQAVSVSLVSTVTDPAGNAAQPTTKNTTADVPGSPTVTVNQAAGQGDPTNETTIDFTVVFNEPVTGLTAGDFVITGTATGAQATSLTGGPTTYALGVTGMTSDGTVIANLPAGVAIDVAGNPNLVSTSSDNVVTRDATVPTFDSIAASTTPTVSAFFSEPLLCSTVSASDFLASIAGSPVAVNSVSCTSTSDSAIELTLASSPTAGQSVSISLVGAVTDPAGNMAPAATKSTTADVTGPTVTVNQAAGQADPTNDATIDFTVVFNEPVTGLTAGDFVITGTAADATVTSVTGGPTTYAIGVTGMTGDGTVIASLPAAVVTDLAGNANAASTSTDNTVTFDETEPTVTIDQAAAQDDPTIVSPINFTAVFSEQMTGFVGTDVSITGTAGGTKSAIITGGPTTYNIAVSGMTTPGTVIVTIPAGAATDLAGNGNLVSTSTDNTVTWDVAPTVTVEQAAAQADPTNDDPINFTATFSESVTGFVDADVTIGGTAGGTLSATVIGSGTTYNIAITGMTTDGTVTASIGAGKAVDAGEFGNLASTSSDNAVTWDTTPPEFSWVSSTAGSSTVTAVFGSVDDPVLCSTVAAGDFLATVNLLPVAVSGVTCDGTADATIQVALASAPAAGQTTSLALAGTVTDRAGNTVAEVTNASVASSPTLSVSSGVADGGSTSDTTPTYSGTAADGADTVTAVQVSTDGGLTFSSSGVTCLLCDTLSGIGVNWSYTPASPLALGAHTLVFRAVDDDGGFSLPSVRHVTITG